MNLQEEIERSVRAFIAGGSIEDLRAWLSHHAEAIAECGDPSVQRLSGRAWILSSELDYGHRDEIEVRWELGKFLQALHTPKTGWDRAATTYAQSKRIVLEPAFERTMPSFGSLDIPVERSPVVASS